MVIGDLAIQNLVKQKCLSGPGLASEDHKFKPSIYVCVEETDSFIIMCKNTFVYDLHAWLIMSTR